MEDERIDKPEETVGVKVIERYSVEIGVFAHNEANSIRQLLEDLANQTAFVDSNLDLLVTVLANGCSDDTVDVAQDAISALSPEKSGKFRVVDLKQAGKSRTWNAFVHDIARPDVQIYVMVDGDIRLPESSALGGLISGLIKRPELRVFTSRPVKDLEFSHEQLSVVERAIAAGGGGLADWRRSLCGQFYAIKGNAARRVWLPVGLPVEDGFLHAMVVTDFLTDVNAEQRIDGDESVWHLYGSIRTIPELISHQVRIVIGSAVNSALFRVIRRDTPNAEQAAQMLQKAASADDWLRVTLARELPRAPFAYVPFHFLYKRLLRYSQLERRGIKQFSTLIVGLGLDAVVYFLAQMKMAQGRAAGYW
jgi:glycosyltransferase involved in cell wall biosynthesis